MKVLKFLSIALLVSFGVISTSGCVATAPVVVGSPSSPSETQKKWACQAPNLVTANYTGGGYAYVHLSGFTTGGNYPVVKNGSIATGTTANGTKFTCSES